jgi:hypothetical protein
MVQADFVDSVLSAHQIASKNEIEVVEAIKDNRKNSPYEITTQAI